MKCKGGYRFHNWDSSLTCHPRNYCQPARPEDIIDLVQEARNTGGRVRTVGAGHSWSPLVITDETLVNLDKLDQVIETDAAAGRARIQSGIRLKSLTPQLANRGLGLANVGSILEQSLAGATGTGTHGTGLSIGNLSTQIAGMQLVTGTGDLLSITENDHDLLTAARLSLGALGIITEITLQCLPVYDLEFSAYVSRFDTMLEQFNDLLRSHTRVRFYWLLPLVGPRDLVLTQTIDPPGNPALRKRAMRRESRREHSRRYKPVITTSNLMRRIHQEHPAALKTAATRPKGLPVLHCIDRYDRALTVKVPPLHQECEYALPLSNAIPALQELRKLDDKNHYKLTLPIEVRFVSRDDTMLSPSFGRDVCYIGAYTSIEPDRIFGDFEPLMKSFGGRPHWGKHLTVTRKDVKTMYPMYPQFNEIRKRLDPNRLFENDLIQRIFGAES